MNRGPSYPEVYEKAKQAGLLDTWLIARQSIHRPYRCRCVLGRRCTDRCWCRGRIDGDAMPAHCCGRPRTDVGEVAA